MITRVFAPRTITPASALLRRETAIARELRFFFEVGRINPHPAWWGRNSNAFPSGNPAILAGPQGPILSLDGVGDRLDWTIVNRSQPQLPGSIVGRVQVDDLSIPCGILATNWSSTTYRGLWLQIEGTTGAVTAQFGDGGGGSASDRRSKSTASGAIASGKWYTVGCTIRAATDIQIYVNGIDLGGTYSGTGSGISFGAGNLAIGPRNGSSVVPDARYQWVGLWGRPLTPEEHMQLHEDSLGSFMRRKNYFFVTGLPEMADAAEVYVDIQVASVEVSEAVDSATVPLTITPGGTESQQGTGTVYEDNATILVSIQVSSVELRESIDDATVLVDIQPSGVDIREQFDAATIYVNITNTGAECFSSAHLTDSGEASVRWSYGLDSARWSLGDDNPRWFANAIASGEPC